MKHLLTILFGVIIIIGLTSCTSNNTSNNGSNNEQFPAAEGYIIQIDENRVLVLDSVKEEDLGKTWNELVDYYQGRAIWLETSDVSKLEVGQKVRFWVDGPIQESYPEQGSAERIEVIKNN